jgi:hypothetical protein
LHRDFELFAASLVEQLPEGRVVGQVESKTLQRFLNRILVVIGDGRDLAAPGVLKHEALEQVVDVASAKGQVDLGIAIHFAFTLEVTNATVEQNDLGDRHRGRNGRSQELLDGRLSRSALGQPEKASKHDDAG